MTEFKENTIVDLCLKGLYTDGAHHKQWYLEEILRAATSEETLGILKYVKEMGDWEDGVAP